jgi:uncharacterized membrane protein
MAFRNVLLSAHILAAILFIGWLAMQGIVLPAMIRRGPENAAFVRSACTVSAKAGPATSLVLLLGVWLVLRDRHDAYSFGDGWIGASIAIFVATGVIGGVVIGRAEQRAAEKLTAGQPAPEEARTIAIGTAVNLVLLVAVVWLMVAKPGA